MDSADQCHLIGASSVSPEQDPIPQEGTGSRGSHAGQEKGQSVLPGAWHQPWTEAKPCEHNGVMRALVSPE